MTTIVLVCAILASMAAGVLLAYGVCLSLFAMFRLHAKQAQTERQMVARKLRPLA